jgi:hypothetical protein
MHDVVELVRSYGPGMAGWVFFLIFLAFFAGRAGRMALGNVQGLLRNSEELRLNMKKSLDDCHNQIAERDLIIHKLRNDNETLINQYLKQRDEVITLKEKVLILTLEKNRIKELGYDRPPQGEK